ncbi:MAG: 50S ribosomal protein L10 [Patescibacteria group bacterium]
MALTREKKSVILEKVKKAVKSAQSIAFVNFHGLSVSGADDLRKGLREVGVGYSVAKKTLVRLALADSGIAGNLPDLPGEIAIAYGDDLIAPAKGVYDFGKKNNDTVKIVGGVFEGRFMDADEMLAVAKIPGREVLYGQFVNLINWPIQGLVVALDAIAEKKG